MVLFSHIIVATAVALPLATRPITPTNAVIIFVVAFCSHYIVDSIPHWDYKLHSIRTCHREKKEGYIEISKLKKDILNMTFDGLLGVTLSFILISLSSLDITDKLIVLSIVTPASILPDAIEVINIFFKKQPIAFIHKIHFFFHRKNIFMGEPAKGLPLQIATILLIIFFSIILL